jgi:hypothetical protein
VDDGAGKRGVRRKEGRKEEKKESTELLYSALV